MILLKSIIVGIFSLLPGVSGSALAITFNLYDRFFKSIYDIQNNKLFFIELFLGILIGLFIGSKITIYIIGVNIIYYALIGVILSEIPLLIKKCELLSLPLVISFILSSLTNYFTSSFLINININIRMFFGGILFSFGKIIPGISSSCLLLSLGIYKDIMIIFSKPSILLNNYYIPFIIGSLIGVLFFAKLLTYMINNHYNLFYSMIIGFIMSSIFLIVPKYVSITELITGLILMIVFFTISLKIKRKF